MGSEHAQRWAEAFTCLRAARAARLAGCLDEAFSLYTQAHNLGDDNVRCHARGHLGRAWIELRRSQIREAAIDTFWATTAMMVSTIRRLLGRRGAGITLRVPTA